eukprot:scaffold620_cov169-Amphora_coffeaeformis.AAC.14
MASSSSNTNNDVDDGDAYENVELGYDTTSGAISVHGDDDDDHHHHHPEPLRKDHDSVSATSVEETAARDELTNEDAASIGASEEFLDRLLPQLDELGRPIQFPVPEEEPSWMMRSSRRTISMSVRAPSTVAEEEDEIIVMDKKEAPHSVMGSGLESIKYLYSIALLVFSIVVVMATIFSGQSTATSADDGLVPRWVACLVFWFLIIWLATMEGGQAALVGLQPIDKEKYAASHPRAFASATAAHRGDNMERFIVGRQFLVVLIVFVINLMASAAEDANVLDLNDSLREVFLSSGVAVILTTVMLGQLTAQVNSASSMLDFLNNSWGMVITTNISLAIEMSGLLHCVYLVQMMFSRIAGTPIETDEAPRTPLQKVFFWARVILSVVFLGFALAVTLSAMFDDKDSQYEGYISMIIFFALMCLVGLMEGMQIALFSVVNLPEEELQRRETAHNNCRLAFHEQNLQAFLIGRQICVTVCMFVIARITTLNIDAGENTIFGVPAGVQEFFNTGLLGAVITAILASLAWRIVASSFPIAFLSNPVIYYIIRLCLLIDMSGVCSASWVLARYQRLMMNYQPDNVYLEGAEPQTAEPATRRDKDIDRFITVTKFTYSLALLGFSVILVMSALFDKQTQATSEYGIPRIAAFLIFWFLIVWLAMMEGGQGALVGLQPIKKELYAQSHPRTLRCTQLAHKGDNMGRLIVGRQFLVVLVVFVSNMMASTVPNARVFGLPTAVNEIFLGSGVALILTTITIGQLTSQINAASCMLDFVNNWFMYITTHLSLAIEKSGLLHAVYLVQILFSSVTGEPIKSTEPPRTGFQSIMFWLRVSFSVVILGIAFAVTLAALFDGKTAMWEGVPESVSVILFFVLMSFVGLMEGMQIALFAVVNLPLEELKSHPTAFANCQLTFRDQNLQAFLIGRQICVTICMFVVARITKIDVDIGAGEDTIFGIGDHLQEFLNTGLLGAVITTIVGSLCWRIIASSFPIAFLSNPLVFLIIRLCLLLEASGVCSSAWILGRLHKLSAGYQPDIVHLEGAERHGKEPITRRDKDIDVTLAVLKFAYSFALLIFSVTVVMSAYVLIMWSAVSNVLRNSISHSKNNPKQNLYRADENR